MHISEPLDSRSFVDSFPRNCTREAILHVLRSATRAPSTHNSQPWRFRVTDNVLEIFADQRILLPRSDRDGRYKHISIGCLLHHIALLARFAGRPAEVQLLVGDGPIARVSFGPFTDTFDRSVEPLVDALFSRRNRRGPFQEGVTISQSTVEEIQQTTPLTAASVPVPKVAVSTAREPIARIAAATARNMVRLYKIPAFRREMARWIVPTGARRRRGLPGYSLNQPVVASWILPTIIRFINMGPMLSKLNYGAVSSASAIVGYASGDTPAEWVGVGFQASHSMLHAVADGYDTSVYVASIELDDTRADVTEALALGSPVQLLFAVGKLKGDARWRTPRVPIEQLMVDS